MIQSWPSCLWQELDNSAAFLKFLRKIYLLLFHVHGCFSCKSECAPHASLVTTKAGKEPWIPWTGVRVSCEPSYGC